MGHNSRQLLKSFNFYSVSVSCCQHIFYIDFSLIKDPKDLRYVMIYSSQLLLLELNLNGEEPVKFFTFNSLGEVVPLIFIVGIKLDGEEPVKFFTFNSLGEVAPLIFMFISLQ